MVPKTEIEFRANLRTMVSKSIELKNPSSKAIIYDVTIEGSSDFRAKGTEVCIIQLFAVFPALLRRPQRTSCSSTAPTIEQEYTLNLILPACERLAAATEHMWCINARVPYSTL